MATTRAAAHPKQPSRPQAPPLGVGMVGYAFMGAAHSQGWRTAGRVFDLPLRPVLSAVCGRDADAVRAAADRHGWAAAETDWRALIARDDVAARRHLHARRQPCRDRHRRAGRGQARAVREAARQHGRRGRGHGGGGRGGPRARAVRDGGLQLPPRARPRLARRMVEEGRLGVLRHVRVTLSPGLAGRPGVPSGVAAAPGARRAPARSATWARTSSTSRSTWRESRWPASRR